METFSALLVICAGNSPVTGEFPTQRPVTRSFDVFFDLRLNKWLSKQSGGWWFETPSRSLWRHYNGKHAPLAYMGYVFQLWAKLSHITNMFQCASLIRWKEGNTIIYDSEDFFLPYCNGSCHFQYFRCSQQGKFGQDFDTFRCNQWQNVVKITFLFRCDIEFSGNAIHKHALHKIPNKIGEIAYRLQHNTIINGHYCRKR